MVEHNQSSYYNNGYKFNGKEQDEATGMYYYGARYYDPRISIFVSVDPLAEEFVGWTPYHYVHNNPINLIDPTGMSAEGPPDWWKSVKRSFSLSKIRSDMKKNDENSGWNHWAKWFNKHSPFTKAERQNKIRSNKPIGASARSKNGGGEGPTTTGPYKQNLKNTKSGSFNADYILGAGSAFGGPYAGNKYKSTKDGFDVVKSAASGWGFGETGGESTVESGQDVYKHTMRVISTYEIFADDGTIDSVKTEYKNIELQAKTPEELKIKMDSADYDNKVEIQRRDAWLQ